jgi:purine-binding chemotaxis protein CheW
MVEEKKGGEDIWVEIHRRVEALSLKAVGEMTAEELKDLWYRRALELSRSPDHEKAQGDRLNLVTFTLGPDHYGVGLEMVREIQRAGRITPVPTAPDFIVGVMNLRGNILSVVDIRAFFGLPGLTIGEKTRILVVEGSGLRIGILVERVDEITDVREEDVKPPLSSDKGLAEDYIRGIVTYRGEMLIVIDLGKVLANPRLVVEEKV